MNEARRREIAMAFPPLFETGFLGLELPLANLQVFEDGFFARDMDDKWNIVLWDGRLYFARSWTGFCIYRIPVQVRGAVVSLPEFQVSRDERQYRSIGLDQEAILLKKMLQSWLGREDLYVDPELRLPGIQKTIATADPDNACRKSIGHSSVEFALRLYDSLSSPEQRRYVDVAGWTELRNELSGFEQDTEVITLYLHHRQTNKGATYYFDPTGERLLGHVVVHPKPLNPA